MVDVPQRAARWGALGCAILMTGCASTTFTVDTSQADPLIYAPGTAPGKALDVPLEGVELRCDAATVSIVSSNATFKLTRRLWHGASGVRTMAVASIDPANVAQLVKTDNIFTKLIEALDKAVTPSSCRLDSAAPVAAAELRRQLPLGFSTVLRHAYNHQLWPKGDKTTWVSVDLQPGMRLRVENSLPISPAGINSAATHPSSFSAPTYLYFDPISGPELCDPGAKPHVESPDFHCNLRNRSADVIFLSATSGLARLGLFQKSEGLVGGKKARAASGLIDLQERTNEGEGAWRHWRLWIPSHRDTKQTQALTAGGVGSEEAVNSAPILVAATTLKDLGSLATASSLPCEGTPTIPPITWSCQSLHYRAVPIPEIAVVVNGAPRWVPIGSTLHDLLAHRLHEHFVPEAHVSTAERRSASQRRALSNVEVFRRHRGALHPVEASTLEGSANVRAFLRLQLLPGDEIRWH